MIVAHGDTAASDRVAAAGADLVIAAAGGALALERWGILPHVAVGDFDSLGEEGLQLLAARGTTIVRHEAAKDASDLELALDHALASGATEVLLLGIFGGARLDHALANAMLLADPRFRGRNVRAVHASTGIRGLFSGERADLDGPVGSTVTLLPVHADAVGVRTSGLRFPLAGETLRFGRSRGLSNVVSSQPAWVSLEDGSLLVIEIREGGS
ncbi:MAG: thiamine diphosphokinase [Chloroflexota bacterium]